MTTHPQKRLNKRRRKAEDRLNKRIAAFRTLGNLPVESKVAQRIDSGGYKRPGSYNK